MENLKEVQIIDAFSVKFENHEIRRVVRRQVVQTLFKPEGSDLDIVLSAIAMQGVHVPASDPVGSIGRIKLKEWLLFQKKWMIPYGFRKHLTCLNDPYEICFYRNASTICKRVNYYTKLTLAFEGGSEKYEVEGCNPTLDQLGNSEIGNMILMRTWNEQPIPIAMFRDKRDIADMIDANYQPRTCDCCRSTPVAQG